MKKARNMFVLALVLLSVISIGSVAGTYAKYTSTKELSDQARVAKWMDFENNDSLTLNLFSKEYDGTVKSSTEDKVIAPGTTQTMNFAINIAEADAPEVDYQITFAKDDTKTAIDAALVDKIKFSADGTTWGTIDEAIAKLNESPVTQKAGAVASLTASLQWKWDFNVDDATDESDTTLGKAGTAKAVVGLKITATQVD